MSDFLNIARKKHQDKTGKKHARRALDGMGIASHSKYHKDRINKKLETENIDQAIKRRVIEHARAEVSEYYGNDTKKREYYNKYKGAGAAEEFYDALCNAGSGRPEWSEKDKEDVKKVFNALREEANIIATSHAPLLWIGKVKTGCSLKPKGSNLWLARELISSCLPRAFLGNVTAAMNEIMRKIPFFGKSLGDMDANNNKNFAKKGEVVFDISKSLDGCSERAEKDRTEGKAGDRVEDGIERRSEDTSLKLDDAKLAISEKPLTLEQRKELASSSDIQVQDEYHASQLGKITSEYRTLVQHKKDGKGIPTTTEESQKVVDSIKAKIKDYKESLPEGGVPDYLDKYFENFKALYDLQKVMYVSEITKQITALMSKIVGGVGMSKDALLAQIDNPESQSTSNAFNDFVRKFEEKKEKEECEKV